MICCPKYDYEDLIKSYVINTLVYFTFDYLDINDPIDNTIQR